MPILQGFAGPGSPSGEDWRDSDPLEVEDDSRPSPARPLSLPLIVLAAGLSTRYGRLKQLEPLGPGGEAIMDYNVLDALRAGFDGVTYIVRAEIERDLRHHVERVWGDSLPVEYVSQELAELPEGFRPPPDRRKPWGTAHAVLCAAGDWTHPFAVCNADDLYGPQAFEVLHAYLAQDPVPTAGVLVGYPLHETLSDSGGVARGICHVGRDSMLEHVIEVREIRRRHDSIVGLHGEGIPVELDGNELVSMNLWGLTPRMVDGLRRRFARFLDVWGASADREFYLSTAINEQLQVQDSNVRVLHADEPWFGLTHAEDAAPARTQLLERIAAGVYPSRLADALAPRS